MLSPGILRYVYVCLGHVVEVFDGMPPEGKWGLLALKWHRLLLQIRPDDSVITHSPPLPALLAMLVRGREFSNKLWCVCHIFSSSVFFYWYNLMFKFFIF